MIGVYDIFFEIAQKLRSYTGADPRAAIEEFLRGSTFDIHLSITTDIEETTLSYLERYGSGHTFCFQLKDYFHGKELVSDIYCLLKGERPNMCKHTGILFQPGEKLYLFIHLRNVEPAQHKFKLEHRSIPISSVEAGRSFQA
jgi:hypothetical protein